MLMQETKPKSIVKIKYVHYMMLKFPSRVTIPANTRNRVRNNAISIPIVKLNVNIPPFEL